MAAPEQDAFAAEGAWARRMLLREIEAYGALRDPAWRAAFAEVPRHLFVPSYYAGGADLLRFDDPDPARRDRWLRGAYRDEPLAVRMRDGELVSSSSQPSLMALMLETLEVRDGDDVLEIGAGSGYNAALLCHRLGDDRVTTIDLDEEITASARAHLAAAGHRPAVITGDGAGGCPTRAPFDRIVATCTLPSVPYAWLGQCRPGARILAPLSTGLILLTVRDARHAEGRFLATPAYFVPLRGTPPAPQGRLTGLPRKALDSETFRFALTLTAAVLDAREAYSLWQRERRPGRDRFGVTVADGRQWAWLDDPEGPYAWPLGMPDGN
ncbi:MULTISPECIES: methyltransferase domain-containing protein [Streptomyces]|uniref:Protein-L-isoaspartate O-methyltransferase n=1 Tax=Streptomyces solicathayae TaxID=3081768 RepID=A0ABZ0LXT3_9ACTN|nr:methyltransferase domain-containing protein [Streptomyces sp. HUAS YS2]WOX24326.1 methyltransferase domain-containing protein [Streptomyces sp. HUAS YS2]